ncbi:Xanthine dehydrogenase/oxidase [Holothuria leucospilota]|uniref:Xanthine dehydrogenase/oxidase n=1 Tax=Holothuria leucospilota TaxID=206669 RepID=A0A9Q1HI75_HOLLE|nr:Xanthine dehydrogenase/oxidase [Holothuria leucospilota]
MHPNLTMAGLQSDVLMFYCNGKKILEKNVDPRMNLNTYLRYKLFLTGTKRSCSEGGCGACTAMLSYYDVRNKTIRHLAVNTCLIPLCAVHHMAVTTVEGIGSTRSKIHPVQERIAKAHGSQCGFCTPGFVMSMYSLLRNNPKPLMADIEEALLGNLCRCTGYRPILEGFQTFTKQCCGGIDQDGCCQKKQLSAEEKGLGLTNKLIQPEDWMPYDPSQDVIFPPELRLCAEKGAQSVTFVGQNSTWIRPVTLQGLFDALATNPEAQIIAGGNSVVTKTGFLSALSEVLQSLAGVQIRNVGTIGGNLFITGPYISDVKGALMAGECCLHIASSTASRRVTFTPQFYSEGEKPAMKPDEILLGILLPFTNEEVAAGQPDIDPVGRPKPFKSAFQQATGEARYVDDIAVTKNELFLAFVSITSPHAKIISVDFTKALSTDGVVDVVSARDIPGINFFEEKGEFIFAEDEVVAPGQPIAGVLAVTEDIARTAANLVKVDYEELDFILTIEDAVERNSFFPYEREYNKGDVDLAFTNSDHVVSGEMRTGMQEHFYMETQTALVQPAGEHGEFQVYTSCQSLSDAQIFMARVLNVPSNRIVCHTKRIGGAFGGKGDFACFHAIRTAVAANKVNCPVRAVLDRHEDMTFSGQRASFLAKYKVGFNKEGKLHALDWDIYSNVGNSVNMQDVLMDALLNNIDNAYLCPNMRARGKLCKTNLPASVPMRSTGTGSGMAFGVNVINHIASTLGVAEEKSAALVHIYTDGEVLISHGGIEMGQGLYTKMLQIASRTLRLPMERIHCAESSTNTVPNTVVTHGSIGSDYNGPAVQNACEILLQRLEPYMHENPKGAWEAWVQAAYNDRVSLSATGFYKVPEEYLSLNPNFNDLMPTTYHCYGAAATEVEIDCLTGDHRIIRTDIVMDVGDSLNPAVDIGQIEGAFIQGYGLYVLEDYRYSPSGELLTIGPGGYKIPICRNIPSVFNVSLLHSAPNPRGICSSKAVGEPPFLLATSVFFAIKEAIASARSDEGLSGYFPLYTPSVPERIRLACQDKFTTKAEVYGIIGFITVDHETYGSAPMRTKRSCSEGGCGACTAMLSYYDVKNKKIRHLAVNTCLIPLCAVHHMAVTTVEGVGSTRSKIHPVQERIAKAHGSQCGFCTPGFVMSMYSLLRNNPEPLMADIEEALIGNLCRCTGYRPILEGFKTFTKQCCGGIDQEGCCQKKQLSAEEKGLGLTNTLIRTEDWIPYDRSQDVIFPPELRLLAEKRTQSVTFVGQDSTWFRPVALQGLFDAMATNPEAKLIAGGNSVAITRNCQSWHFPVLLCVSHIPDLLKLELVEDGVFVGSSVTMTDLLLFIKEQLQSLPATKTRFLSALSDVLHSLAGVQIRNVGTVGGNLFGTGSYISDLNVAFMAGDCCLYIASSTEDDGGVKGLLTLTDTRVGSTQVPNEYICNFKQSTRNGLDTAIVNASMKVQFEESSDVITNLKLVYGGFPIAGKVAEKTMAKLQGSVSVAFKSFKSLKLQFNDQVSLPQTMQSGFQKKGKDSFQSTQLYQEVAAGQPDIDPVGRPKHVNSALQQATDELFLAFVTIKSPHAKIISVDFTEALSRDGVVDVVSANDIPGINFLEDKGKFIFAEDEVVAPGQPIAGVLAVTEDIARTAANLVKVDFEELDFILTIEDAVERNSFFPYEGECSKGDVDLAFTNSDHVVCGEMRTGMQEHFYMETQTALVQPAGEHGEFQVYASCQSLSGAQIDMARVLNVPSNRIVCHIKRVGGAFGGKENFACLHAIRTAVAANKTNRAVRAVLDRHEDMTFSGQRGSIIAKYKVGFSKEGKLHALDWHIYLNVGSFVDRQAVLTDAMLNHIDNAYLCPNMRARGKLCKTNLPVSVAMRAIGIASGMVLGVNVINHIASTLGVAEEKASIKTRFIRRKIYFRLAYFIHELNFYKRMDLTHTNVSLHDWTLDRCWELCILRSDFMARKANVEEFNKANRWIKRGLSIVPVKYLPGLSKPISQSAALAHIYTDGEVLISHGGIEMGQGLHTKMLQIASRTLRIPMERIHCAETSTNTIPNNTFTFGSTGTDLNGPAVQIQAAYNDRVSLSATGFYKAPEEYFSLNPHFNDPIPTPYQCYGAAATEVEIDCLTGDHRIIRTDIVMDVGDSLNPAVDIGQIEGAFIQGYGMYVLEDYRYSPSGELLTKGPGSYKIPICRSIPSVFNVSLLHSAPNPRGISSSKAVGEPPFLLAASVFSAIKEAIASARSDEGLSGYFPLYTPLVPERIRLACQDKFTKKILEKNADPRMNLNTYLRYTLYLTGTKRSCSEGGCGACTAMLSYYDVKNKKIRHLAVNTCLIPLCAVHHMAVTTVEGIGSTRSKIHPVQERIAKAHGSQCGFCTPGFVMSMYSLLRNNPEPSMADIEEALIGNLCRCTGYRPILEGFHTFAKQCCGGIDQEGCCQKKQISAEEKGVGLTNTLIRTEDWIPYDPSQDVIFPPELRLLAEKGAQSVTFVGQDSTWIRPVTLQGLFDAMATNPEAKLIAGGNTVAIASNFQHRHFPVLLCVSHIPDLLKLELVEDGVFVGSSVTMTDLRIFIKEQLQSLPATKTRFLSALSDVLLSLAGVQIRNVGTVGGNLFGTGSYISDLKVAFMAGDCCLYIASSTVVAVANSSSDIQWKPFATFLELTFYVLNEYICNFKQSTRNGLDTAIVNASMKIQFEESSNIIRKLKLVYGGFPSAGKIAEKTMAKLRGRKWDSNIVDEACTSLLEDLCLPYGSPGGMEKYKKSLALSFFFKFYLKVRENLSQKFNDQVSIPQTMESGFQKKEKDSFQSTQLYQEVAAGQPDIDPVGRPKHVKSALQQATDELFLAFVTIKSPHAKIISVDFSEALSRDGVVDVVSANDIPGINFFEDKGEFIFAEDEVVAPGQPIAGILAVTEDIARTAANLVKVDFEELDFILTIEDAVERNSFFPYEREYNKGDVDVAFTNSDHVVCGEMRTGMQEHFYMETQTALVQPAGEHGEFQVYTSCQTLHNAQIFLSRVLNVPSNRIVCHTKRIGGAFGGKVDFACFHAIRTAVAANKTNFAVRAVLERHEDMAFSGQRASFLAKYKVGFSKDGKLDALDWLIYSNMGSFVNKQAGLMDSLLNNIDNAYLCPNMRARGKLCKTNLPASVSMRSTGTGTGIAMGVNVINHIASTLGVAEEKIHELNFYKRMDLTHTNVSLHDWTLDRCWELCILRSDFIARKATVEKFNKANRWIKKGLSIVPVKYPVGVPKQIAQSAALVHIYTDGEVLISHGGIEMGQGLYTKMLQIASRTLCLPMERIHCAETSTNTIPNNTFTFGSTGADLNGPAVQVQAAYIDRVSLSATGFYKVPEEYFSLNPNFNELMSTSYHGYGAAATEVEIDCLTGDHHIIRTDIVMDVGDSLNPAVDIGQIEGAFIQGYGMYVLEDYRYSPSGELLTKGPGGYKIPICTSIPSVFNVSLLHSAPNPRGISSSKAVGEPPFLLATSVFSAIKEAIASARSDEDLSGYFPLFTPLVPERIRLACQDKFTKKIEDPEPESYTPYFIRP